MASYQVNNGQTSTGIVLYTEEFVIRSGGTAIDTIISSPVRGGMIYVSKGGVAIHTKVYQSGCISIAKSGTANDTIIYAAGSMVVSGGTANNTILSGSSFWRYNEEEVSYGLLDILSGGTANSTTIFLGSMYVNSSGTANYTTINSGGIFSLNTNATANHTVINSGAVFSANRETSINDTTVNSGGTFALLPSAETDRVTIHSGGSMIVSNLGTATNIEAESGAYLGIVLGSVTCMTGTSGGVSFEFKDGAISDYVLDNGYLRVLNRCTANNITVNAGGKLDVLSGATAMNILENGGYVEIETGTPAEGEETGNEEKVSFLSNTISGLSLSRTSTTVHSGTTATELELDTDASVFVFSSGLIDSTAVNQNAKLFISSCGIANAPTINPGGYCYVAPEGTAAGVVENGGFVSVEEGADVTFAENTFSGQTLSGISATVHSGTTAKDTVLRDNGTITVFHGGKTSDTSVDSGGILHVLSGGIAEGDTVHIGGCLRIESDGTANGIVENGGFVSPANGAKATFASNAFSKFTLLNQSATVHSGTTAVLTTVSRGGNILVFSGGTANDTTIYSDGSLNVSSGGTANGTTIYSDGSLNVSSGGTANDTAICFDGTLNVSGGTANDTTVNGNGTLHIYDSGTANRTVVNQWGKAIVSDGGAASGITVNSNGSFQVSGNGVADTAAVNSGGSFLVLTGGTAINTAVNPGGLLVLSRGAAAAEIRENGGYVSVADNSNVTFASNTISGLALSGRTSATVHSGTSLIDATVDANGGLLVFSGGSAKGIAAASGAYLGLDVAPGTFIAGTSDGLAFEVADGSLTGYTFASGYLNVFDGGTADHVVMSGGSVNVHGNGTAAHVVMNGGTLNVLTDGAVNGTAVNSMGKLYVSNGGTANDITVNENGTLHVLPGGTANGAAVNSNGTLHVSTGGTANIISVETNGTLVVSSDGTAAEVVENGGYVEAADGATVTFAENTILGLELNTSATVHSGTTADSTVINRNGRLHVFSHGVADNTTVNAGGSLFVSSGGSALLVTENGGYVDVADEADVTFASHTISGLDLAGASATIHSGTTATDIILVDSSTVFLFSGGKLTGRVICAGGNNRISASEGAVVDFDLTRTLPGAGARVTDLSLIQGDPGFTITVNADQAEGIYALADGAEGFGGVITVVDTGGVEFGTFSVGETITVSDTAYTLDLLDDTLSLKIGEAEPMSPCTSDGLVADYGTYFIQPEEVFHDTTVLPSAQLTVSSGGTADRINVCPDGSLVVLSGGTATGIIASSGANLIFEVAENTLIAGTSGGSAFEIRDGGISGGILENCDISVYSGGTATGLEIASGGSLSVSAGGTAEDLTVRSGGFFCIFSGGTATGLDIESGAYLGIQVAADTFIAGTSGGIAFEIRDGLASNCVIDSGYLHVLSGARANQVSISSGGSIHVSSGGTATDIAAESGACLGFDVASDTRIAGTSGGSAFEFDDETVSGGTIMSGHLNVVSGGTVRDTVLSRGGAVYVAPDGVASSIVVSDGTLLVSSGGTADAVEFKQGGLKISSGGTVTNLSLNPFDSKSVNILDGAYVTYRNSGVYLGGGGRFYSHEMIMSAIWLENKYTRYGAGYMVDEYTCGDELHIMSGGKVADVKVGDRASMIVSSGGTAVMTEIMYGSVSISSGGTALGVVIDGYTSGRLIFSSGGAVTIINAYGRLNISSGGAATNIIADSSARFYVFSGGTANSATINASASGEISDGGTLNGLIVNSGGRVSVLSGGKLTGRVICNSGGTVTVDADATVDFDLTQMLPGAAARFNRLWDWGNYTITVNADQAEGIYALAENIEDFGDAITIVNTSDETLGVFSVGETVTISDTDYTLFLADGTLSLKVGDDSAPPPQYTANGLIAEESPLSVKSGEIFYDTLVNPGGTLLVASGGSALETKENGGYVDVRAGADAAFAPNMFYGLVLDHASATVHSGTTALSTTVLPGGSLHVFSGGTAADIVWTPCEGHVSIEDGAAATFADRYSGVYYGSGDHLLSSAAAMDFISLGSAREMYVMTGGNVFSTTVGVGGQLTVSSGGTAEEIVWTPCEGHVSIEDGATATFASRYAGVYYGSGDHLLSSAATMEAVTLDSAGEMYIMSDAIAHSTTIRDGGRLYVSSGGLANSVTIDAGGSMQVSSGAYAVSPVVSSGGSLLISSGGTAVGIILHDRLHVSSAGLVAAVVVSSGGKMTVDDGAVSYAFISAGGSMAIEKGSAASTFVSSGGSLLVSAGGTATDITISSGAYLGFAVDSESYLTGSSTTIIPGSNGSADVIVESKFEIMGGLVSGYGIESGCLDIRSGGTVRDITVSSGGSLLISSGGKLTGRLWNSGGVVSAFDGAVVEFDLNQMSPWAATRIVDLSGIRGNPKLTITVREKPEEGLYRLAGHAGDFTGSITVQDMSGTKLGTISVGETITVSDTAYALGIFEDTLTLTVGGEDIAKRSITDYDHDSLTRINVTNGSVANDVVVSLSRPYSNDGIVITGGGIVNDAIISQRGTMNVSSGGTANNTLVNPIGIMYVSNGGVANRTTVSGNMHLYGGGELNDTTIYSGGILYVNGLNIERMNPVLSMGAAANHTIVNSDANLRVLFGGNVNGATINSGGALWVSSGGTATDVTVSSGGHLEIILAEGTCVAGTSSGVSFEIVDGVASGYEVESSYFYVRKGGFAEKVTLSKEGNIRVFSGGIADSTTLNQGCSMYISSGATATSIIENGGYVSVDSAFVNNSRYGTVVSFASNTFSDMVLSDGASATVHSGTTANGVTVDSGCRLIVCGGEAVNIVENGGYVEGEASFASNTISGLVLSSDTFATVHSGTTANSVTVSGRGYLDVFSGGKLTGQMTFEKGAELTFEDGFILDFDISCLKPEDAARVNNLSAIPGAPVYTLTVSDRQPSGSFVLAEGASIFDDVITVRNAAGESFGTITVDRPLITDQYTFTLSLTGSELTLSVEGPDWVAPTVSDIQVSTKALTNQDVMVTACFADDTELAESLYRIGETGEWNEYADGVAVTENTTVFFKAVDDAGNESEIAGYEVRNIDKEPPVITLTGDNVTPLQASTLAAVTEADVEIFYSLDRESWTKYEGAIPVTENGTYCFMATDALGNVGTAEYVFRNILPETDVVPRTQTWEEDGEAGQYIVEYSTDNFEHVIRLEVASNSLDSFQMPAGTYQWRVKTEDGGEWSEGETIVSEEESAAPSIVMSDGDGNGDLFFASTNGTWSRFYYAMNMGSVNDWTGTGETITANGRGRIQNLFFGSADPNVLCLTDGENGDAIFVDDIYTDLPEGLEEQTARLYRIQEVRAGAGDDIVDMTSQRFEYIGDGMTIRGGDGDDVVWANKGENKLFGDAGDDRIVGASGDDVLVGGVGSDSMHGGGGSDIFTFCENWGTDTVEQLETGSVTLWFANGDDSHWDASTLTYTDGDNSVKVSGVAAEQVTLRFGDDGSEQFATLSGTGAFDDFTSQKIFEESGKGILASL